MNKIPGSLNKYLESQARLRKTMESPFAKFAEQQKRYGKILETTAWKKLYDQQKRITEGIKQTADDVEKFKLIMIDFGFPPHYDMAIPSIRKVVAFYNEHGKEKTENALEELVLKEFNDEIIDSYLNNWLSQDWLKDRHNILKEVIMAHKQGLYHSSVCTLLPQLEGVIVSKSQHEGWLNQKKLVEIIESFLDETKKFNFDHAIKMIYVSLVLDSFQHGQIINSPLSRHAILHGADTFFGYRLNSIRCIVLFDYLIYKLSGDSE